MILDKKQCVSIKFRAKFKFATPQWEIGGKYGPLLMKMAKE